MRKNPATSGAGGHLVAVAIVDRVSPFELAVPCEVFGTPRPHLGVDWYQFRLCAVPKAPIRASTGFTIDTEWTAEDILEADTVVVPAASLADHVPAELIDVLRAVHERGARIISVCSGAFALAAAGLLDGRSATTHWMYADELAARYPAIRVDPDVLYIDEGQVLTSAGTAAGIDLCLHVVRRDYGVEVANAVARGMVVPPHRDGGQAQYVAAAVPESDGDPFGETLEWLPEHLNESITVADLAARSAMSARTFARRFRDTTGTTPYRWLVRQRVAEAQRLLETTDMSVEEIAPAVGFGTPTALRQQFRRLLHTTPTKYRDTFGTDAEQIT